MKANTTTTRTARQTVKAIVYGRNPGTFISFEGVAGTPMLSRSIIEQRGLPQAGDVLVVEYRVIHDGREIIWDIVNA